jgi:hypothetical protein
MRPGTKAIRIIIIITSLVIVGTIISKPTLALIPPCQTCGPHESIKASGLGELVCPAGGKTYPNTQIKFNAMVTVGEEGPSKGHLTLTVNPGDFQQSIKGTITSGTYDPSKQTYSISGTTTSDDVCGAPGASFIINGQIGSEAQISSTADDEYTFNGSGDVRANPAKA